MVEIDEEPIAALSSGSLPSAIAVLRVSGRDCHRLVFGCMRSKNLPIFEQLLSSHFYLTQFIDPRNATIIDQVMVVFFKSPHSYTGQDSVEIYFHGSPYIVSRALALFHDFGIRHAEPGEFTRRAFLNGKMDLTSAEGVQSLIHSQSEQQWVAAKQLMNGVLERSIQDLTLLLTEALAWVEVTIDFPDEKETAAVGQREVRFKVDKVYTSLKALESSYIEGKVASEGLSVVMIGEPNSGKSTLLNTLLKTERAIVTAKPGTTRDYLEESCLIEGKLIKLIDTAGIRDGIYRYDLDAQQDASRRTDAVADSKAIGIDEAEAIGIKRSLEMAKQADLILFLVARDETQRGEEKIKEWLSQLSLSNDISSIPFVKILTKMDLSDPISSIDSQQDWLQISCHSGFGILSLKQKLASFVDLHTKHILEKPFITTQRHLQAIKEAIAALDQFYVALDQNAYEEMLAFELKQASRSLASITGRIEIDDILDVIFSSFCIGK